VEIPHVNVLGGSEFLELASRTDASAPTYSDYINVLCKGSDEQIDTTRSQLDKKWRDFISQMESSAGEIADIAKMESGRNQDFMGNRGKNGSAPSARKVQQIDNDIRLGVKQLFAGTTHPYAQLAAIHRGAGQMSERLPDYNSQSIYCLQCLEKTPVFVIDLKGITIVDALTATRCAMILAEHCQIGIESDKPAKKEGRESEIVRNQFLQVKYESWSELPKDSIRTIRDWVSVQDPKNWAPILPAEPRNPLIPKLPTRNAIAVIMMDSEKNRYRGKSSLEATLAYNQRVTIIYFIAEENNQALGNFPFTVTTDLQESFDRLLARSLEIYKKERELADIQERSGKFANSNEYLQFQKEYSEWQNRVNTIMSEWQRLDESRRATWASRKSSMMEILTRVEENQKTHNRLRAREPKLTNGPTSLLESHRSNEREKLFLVPSFEVLYESCKQEGKSFLRD